VQTTEADEEELEYASDSSYHSPPSAGSGRILMVPVSDLEIHLDASSAEVPSNAPMEGDLSSTLTEDRSMSPLHLEEGREEEHKLRIVRMGEIRDDPLGGWEGSRDLPRIVESEAEDLMTSVLDEQPILPSAVSGPRCIQSAGGLRLKKYHPYRSSAYFLGNLHGLPATKDLRRRYLAACGRDFRSPSCRGSDADESASNESDPDGHGGSGSADQVGSRLTEPGDGRDPSSAARLVPVERTDYPRGGIGWAAFVRGGGDGRGSSC